MNEHLRAKVMALFARYDRATLATCGPAGPQISVVLYQVSQPGELELLIPPHADHHFNLETQPAVALLTQSWLLQASVLIREDEQTVGIRADRLHILSEDGQRVIETVDF